MWDDVQPTEPHWAGQRGPWYVSDAICLVTGRQAEIAGDKISGGQAVGEQARAVPEPDHPEGVQFWTQLFYKFIPERQ